MQLFVPIDTDVSLLLESSLYLQSKSDGRLRWLPLFRLLGQSFFQGPNLATQGFKVVLFLNGSLLIVKSKQWQKKREKGRRKGQRDLQGTGEQRLLVSLELNIA
jgi:hypothetical protein